jgi:hypothetical protein
MSIEKASSRIAARGMHGIVFTDAGDCSFFLDCVTTKLAFEQAKAAKMAPSLRQSTGVDAVIEKLREWIAYGEGEYERLRKK